MSAWSQEKIRRRIYSTIGTRRSESRWHRNINSTMAKRTHEKMGPSFAALDIRMADFTFALESIKNWPKLSVSETTGLLTSEGTTGRWDRFEEAELVDQFEIVNGQHRIEALSIGFPIIGSPFQSQIVSMQHAHIARTIFELGSGLHGDLPIIRALGHTKLNKRIFGRFLELAHGSLTIRLLHSYYNIKRESAWWQFFRDLKFFFTASDEVVRQYLDYLSALYYDAIGPGKNMPIQCRTSTVMAMAKGIRESEDFSIMPILADALQDADYTNGDVLHHLRNSRIFSIGSWVFRTLGLL